MRGSIQRNCPPKEIRATSRGLDLGLLVVLLATLIVIEAGEAEVPSRDWVSKSAHSPGHK